MAKLRVDNDGLKIYFRNRKLNPKPGGAYNKIKINSSIVFDFTIDNGR